MTRRWRVSNRLSRQAHSPAWSLVVDWKIGDGETDPLQLAIYRQAWAKAQDLDPVRVATAFHHVLANRLEPVVAGPELTQAATATFFTA